MEITAEVYKGGRVTIPIQIRKALALREGEEVIFRYEDEELTILTQKQLLAEARKALRKEIAEDVSLVDELIADRRAETAKEKKEYSGSAHQTEQKDDPSA